MFEFLASLTNILVQAYYVDHTPYDDSSKHKYINEAIFLIELMIVIVLIVCKLSQVEVALWVGAIIDSIPLDSTT